VQGWAILHNVRIGADLTRIQIKELVGLLPPLEDPKHPRIPKKLRAPPHQEQLKWKLLAIQEQLRELKARVKKLKSKEKVWMDLLVFTAAC
jgi:hypothetical protein